MDTLQDALADFAVASREGRVSRNENVPEVNTEGKVASREGRVSRNMGHANITITYNVASREGRVSRNFPFPQKNLHLLRSRPARDV